jgi:hypothetical protein
MNLESRMRQHYAQQRPGADFDARVLARIVNVSQLITSSAANAVARREAALAGYQLTRARLIKERQRNMVWVAVFSVIATLVAATLAPLAADWAGASAHLLGRSVLPGLSFASLLLFLPLAIWLAVRQPARR